MSAVATVPKSPPSKPPRPTPANYFASGRLFRAIVSLPQHLCASDSALQERWVFFDCCTSRPAERMEILLATVWGTNTRGWSDNGLIYNVVEATELIAQNDADDDTALFECGWGRNGTQHVARGDVDFFVTPAVRALLETALARVTHVKAVQGGAA